MRSNKALEPSSLASTQILTASLYWRTASCSSLRLISICCCGLNEINGRHDWTRTSDLYRVNFEVNDLKPFPHLAFPHSKGPKTPSKLPSFDGELMASFSDLARSMSIMGMLRQLDRKR